MQNIFDNQLYFITLSYKFIILDYKVRLPPSPHQAPKSL